MSSMMEFQVFDDESGSTTQPSTQAPCHNAAALDPFTTGHLQALLSQPQVVQALDRCGIYHAFDAPAPSCQYPSFGNSSDEEELFLAPDCTVQVLSCVGEGAYGNVYKVMALEAHGGDDDDTEAFLNESTTTGKVMALKTQPEDMRWELYIHTQLEARRVAASMSCQPFAHPSSVYRFHDRSFALMEFCAQGTLHSLIQAYQESNKPLDETVIAFYTLQIMRIVSALHQARTLHTRTRLRFVDGHRLIEALVSSPHPQKSFMPILSQTTSWS